MEETFPNLKKEVSINVKEVYRTQNGVDKKKFFMIHNNQNSKYAEKEKY